MREKSSPSLFERIDELLAQAKAEIELGNKHFERARQLNARVRELLDMERAMHGAAAND